jgi:hypothetical protein
MQSQISVENRYLYLPPLSTSAEPTNCGFADKMKFKQASYKGFGVRN